ERRHAALIGEAGGIVRARVLEALVLARAGLHIGRSGVDRRHDGTGARVRSLAGVDGQGPQARPGRFVGVGHDILPQNRGVKSNPAFYHRASADSGVAHSGAGETRTVSMVRATVVHDHAWTR